MKALILAAGFGTRMKPYSDRLHKSLFTFAGQPNLDIIIRRLSVAGCEAIWVNTHHLHHQIEAFLGSQHYPVPVQAVYEPEILGTGGAILNLRHFWDTRPFMVVNGDVMTDLDFRMLYRFHQNHPHPVTLALCDDPDFNTVKVGHDGFILGFSTADPVISSSIAAVKTFTGIQVLDPDILQFIDETGFSTSIDAFRKLMAAGRKIAAYQPEKIYWNDIGTPQRYVQAAVDHMAPLAFKRAGLNAPVKTWTTSLLQGDGSDRTWRRLRSESGSTLILADHGIRPHDTVCEVDAFIDIGRHLRAKNVPVPEIYLYDRFSGLVFMEDWGDVHLQTVVGRETKADSVLGWYKKVIDDLIHMSLAGVKGFDLSWTYQTPCYDLSMILEKECRYFTDAFLRSYLGMDLCFSDLEEDFRFLAEFALADACWGLMHRDFQSRNILVKNGSTGFIDFQGARIGPLQYDLASLLIDPYVQLPEALRRELLDYSYRTLTEKMTFQEKTFYSGYRYCAITRNLQMLGAFGFLSRHKGKTWFEAYIPPALRTLKQSLSQLEGTRFPQLEKVVENIDL